MMTDSELINIVASGISLSTKVISNAVSVYLNRMIKFNDLELTLMIGKTPIGNTYKFVIDGSNGYHLHSFNVDLFDTKMFQIIADHVLFTYISHHTLTFVEPENKTDKASYYRKLDIFVDFVCRNIRGDVLSPKRGMFKELMVIARKYPKYHDDIEYSVSCGYKFWPTLYRQLNFRFKQEIFDELIDRKLWKQLCMYAIYFDVRHPLVDEHIIHHPDLMMRYCRVHKINLIDIDTYVPPIHDNVDRKKFMTMYCNMIKSVNID